MDYEIGRNKTTLGVLEEGSQKTGMNPFAGILDPKARRVEIKARLRDKLTIWRAHCYLAQELKDEITLLEEEICDLQCVLSGREEFNRSSEGKLLAQILEIGNADLNECRRNGALRERRARLVKTADRLRLIVLRGIPIIPTGEERRRSD